MADFVLPHDHGRHKHDEALHRELMNTERFSAVADVFKQLSDPVRVRIFWLLSHREECVINIAASFPSANSRICEQGRLYLFLHDREIRFIS